ncbi:hypothetical protein [Qingshengfaniella alkalisoli]|uniref:Uncharacterized protein n=1 Tax=Qingshengfaniella alkalisoli TaxID=2599296 RepID=A0A5B8IUH3_9RHOB|nr:hypothetical protein [Qingshengfaniella alkalisoli]QDY69304.1 hypothetical protein FPZ52_06455 [Qingshengfaniella alkalisoli]
MKQCEASLAIEAAARAALRDAIFLCDRSPAVTPIRDTAVRLGIGIDETEEDYAVLADKMLRLMVEVSEEKERRSRGYFPEPRPYLSMALSERTTEDQIPSAMPKAFDASRNTALPQIPDEAAPVPPENADLPSDNDMTSQTSTF